MPAFRLTAQAQSLADLFRNRKYDQTFEGLRVARGDKDGHAYITVSNGGQTKAASPESLPPLFGWPRRGRVKLPLADSITRRCF